MNTRDVIKGRRSVRGYNNSKIDWNIMEEILDAGRMAPSSGNLKNYKFIIVNDKKKKEEIAESCLKQNWMDQAAVYVVICNDPIVVKDYYGERGTLYSIQNCAAVAENMLLMANDLGVSSCWIGTFDPKTIRRMLRIPDEIVPEIILVFGYSDAEKENPVKVDVEKITYHNEWKNTNRDLSFWPISKQVRRISDRVDEVLESEEVNSLKNKLVNLKDRILNIFKKRLKFK